jgi:AcrR family transcriptional regulator
MSPRIKTASDEEILKGALEVILRVGPENLRLADVAEEVGLAPATLLQRFKSKKGLLLAVAVQGTASIVREFSEHRAQSSSALDALLRLDPKIWSLAPASNRAARMTCNKLGFVQLGLSDPAFKKVLNARAETIQKELRSLLDEAVTAGSLRACDTRALAHVLLSILYGAPLLGAFEKRGANAVGDVATVLAPFRA